MSSATYALKTFIQLLLLRMVEMVAKMNLIEGL